MLLRCINISVCALHPVKFLNCLCVLKYRGPYSSHTHIASLFERLTINESKKLEKP